MASKDGVDFNDPVFAKAIGNYQRQGWSKEQIYEHGYLGAPMEVIDKYFKKEEKPERHVDEAEQQKRRERMAHARAAKKPRQTTE